MKIAIDHRCNDFNSYRAARVKSLFNVESGADCRIEATLPIEDQAWQIGVIVGPSGSGKTTIGKVSPAWAKPVMAGTFEQYKASVIYCRSVADFGSSV